MTLSNLGRTLIIGAGSGRDIVNALLVREELRHAMGPADLAGFLTPWAWHSFHGYPERPVNDLRQPARKFSLLSPTDDIHGFFEPELPQLCDALDVGIEKFWAFSLQHGKAALLDAAAELVAMRRYDTVIAVDIGGDILATEDDRGTLLTPIVDFTCLEVIHALQHSVRTIVAVVDPGICGEVTAPSLRRTIARLDGGKAVLDVHSIERSSRAIDLTLELSRRIDETGSTSYTAHVLELLADTRPSADFLMHYAKTYKFCGRSWSAPFDVSLAPDLVNRVFFFDGPKTANLLGHSLEYESVLEAFVQMREWGSCGTEVDFSAVRMPLPAGSDSPAVLLTPCCHFHGEARRRLVREATRLANVAGAKAFIFLREDVDAVALPADAAEIPLSEKLTLIAAPQQAEAMRNLFPKTTTLSRTE